MTVSRRPPALPVQLSSSAPPQPNDFLDPGQAGLNSVTREAVYSNDQLTVKMILPDFASDEESGGIRYFRSLEWTACALRATCRRPRRARLRPPARPNVAMKCWR